MSILFVYGSLKLGQSAHGFLEEYNGVYLREAVSDSRYHIYRVGWFPGMVINEDLQGGIHGELYQVNDKCLEALDRYEGVPSLFCRDQIVLDDGSSVIAYRYVKSISGCKRFENGIWDAK